MFFAMTRSLTHSVNSWHAPVERATLRCCRGGGVASLSRASVSPNRHSLPFGASRIASRCEERGSSVPPVLRPRLPGRGPSLDKSPGRHLATHHYLSSPS